MIRGDLEDYLDRLVFVQVGINSRVQRSVSIWMRELFPRTILSTPLTLN